MRPPWRNFDPSPPERGESLDPTAILTAIDVSNYQALDLSGLVAQFDPDVFIVRMWLPWEKPSPTISRAQVASALAHGKYVLPYAWAYAGTDAIATVNRAWALAESCGITIRRLMLDVESYSGARPPGAAWLEQADAAAAALGIELVIYTNVPEWASIGNPQQFRHLAVVVANYNGRPDLAVPLPAGGWTYASGHQWTQDPVDRSVILAALVA